MKKTLPGAVLLSLMVLCVGCVTTLSNGMKLTPKSVEDSLSPLSNGRFDRHISGTLAKDWVHPTSGMILKSGTGVRLSENGSIVRATLAKPWKDPATGKQYQADTEYAFK